MEIKFICTYWGKQHMPVGTFVETALDAGFDGIELNISPDKKFIRTLSEAVAHNNGILIAQQWVPPARESVEQYRTRMTASLTHQASLAPVFINSHTGKDYYSFDENCSLIETAKEIEENTGVKILHETHRGRFTHHAASLLPYLQKYPKLELCADFSHFCAVSESLLEDQEEILDRIIPAVRYIHARVGYDQSAQVNHPFAPEWELNLMRFVSWWQRIIDQARERGEEIFHICPEFGPAPYMPALPFTGQPVADQWQINLEMVKHLKKSLVV